MGRLMVGLAWAERRRPVAQVVADHWRHDFPSNCGLGCPARSRGSRAMTSATMRWICRWRALSAGDFR
ncbi:hypothetical protein ABY58_16550 [Edwardsiella ictaluri]|nr:hypothetical protein ABY58_16550 [Edwardsiella ictaluri]